MDGDHYLVHSTLTPPTVSEEELQRIISEDRSGVAWCHQSQMITETQPKISSKEVDSSCQAYNDYETINVSVESKTSIILELQLT